MNLDVPEFIPQLVDVSFRADVDGNKRIYYNPDENNKKFYPTWNTGDLVSVVTDLDKDLIAPFTVTSDGTSASIHGQINRWRGKTNIYAIYPHKECAYDHNGGIFTVNISSQSIDGKVPNKDSYNKTDNAMKNAILLAKAKNVTIDTEGNIDVDNLHFRQAMSFLRFTLVHKGHELRRITLRSKNSDFYKQAKISYVDNGVKYIYDENSKTNEVYSDNIIADPSEKSIINFALFPTTVDGFELEIQTFGTDEKAHVFTKEINGNLTFKRNEFNYFSNALDLNSADDFPIYKDAYFNLKDLTWDGDIPPGNNWVIESNPTINSTEDIKNLKNAIDRAKRPITLRFPEVTDIACNSTFWSWEYLEILEFPNCKQIGVETFRNCPNLKKVVMPSLETAGINTFYDDVATQVEFIAGTNTNKPLEYGKDGKFVHGEDNKGPYKYEGTELKRVHITLANKHLYDSNQNGENSLINSTDNKPVYFGSITWQ